LFLVLQKRKVEEKKEMRLEGKVTVVTGGAQGIGRGIAECFLREGARVVIVDLDEEAGEQAASALADAGEFLFIRADVGNPAEIASLAGKVRRAFGPPDILVNNAGIMVRKPLQELSLQEWERVLGVNLTAPFLLVREFASDLRERRGAVVNIASTRALMSEAHTEAYAASKGGLVALTHALAVSLGPQVRVNCISPGWIDVSGWHKDGEAGQERLSEEDYRQHPAGRVGTPEDVAALALYLASDESAFVTGQNFVIDGGMTRKMIYV
jgi:NAD(P)-dependent dehydrogenase (short-subunit alcohol dehydrogenase family)